jgi:hypothetical protein
MVKVYMTSLSTGHLAGLATHMNNLGQHTLNRSGYSEPDKSGFSTVNVKCLVTTHMAGLDTLDWYRPIDT